MNNEEKLKAILERLKLEGTEIEAEHISAMMIVKYLAELEKAGVIECGFKITPLGETVASICEEFEWKPEDKDIIRFVIESVEDQERPAFAGMIQRWRDDKDAFLKEYEEALKQQPPQS